MQHRDLAEQKAGRGRSGEQGCLAGLWGSRCSEWELALTQWRLDGCSWLGRALPGSPVSYSQRLFQKHAAWESCP